LTGGYRDRRLFAQSPLADELGFAATGSSVSPLRHSQSAVSCWSTWPTVQGWKGMPTGQGDSADAPVC
jgi:hypothetical protein